MMQGSRTPDQDADPMVVDAVETVRDRFGAAGLRSLAALATSELTRVEQAEAQLASLNQSPQTVAAPVGEAAGIADTQAWLAYTEADPGSDAEGDRV